MNVNEHSTKHKGRIVMKIIEKQQRIAKEKCASLYFGLTFDFYFVD